MGKKHKKHKSEKKSSDAPDDTGTDGSAAHSGQGQTTDTSEKGEKPLKLVFKLGPQETSESFNSPQTEERPKHKHKKKKKKKEGKDREREEQGSSSSQKRSVPEEVKTEPPSEEPPPKKANTETDSISVTADGNEEGETIEDRVRHSPRACAIKADDGAILRTCLEYLQKALQSKDVNGFFAFPVTDSIAPGYSNIIHTPMDFSTMETKIEKNDYRSVMEYKKDFLLMCTNAMTYNRPETVYYKEAKRLVHIGVKQLSKEKLLTMKKTQSWLSNLTLAEIGIDENGRVLEELPPIPEEIKHKEKPKSKSTKTVGTPFEPFPDNLSPEEILAQAQTAAKKARQELTVREPKTDLVFLRRNKKGITTLNILNPEDDGIVSNTERVVNLGDLVGKLPAGTGALQGFKEDKRNKVTPVQYVNYGPFSSFAPQYDSSFASVNKDESDLLLATYGDETGVQYAKSVQGFVDSAGDYAVKMVNNLLDMLTKGQHTRTNHALEQQRKQERERAAAAEEEESKAETSPASSEKLMSPQGDAASSEATETTDPLQKRLNSTAEMIGDLQRTQDARLSQAPPAHLAHCAGPSDKEMELASKVTEGLADLTSEVTPGDLVSVNRLRKAMGISSQAAASQPSTTDPESCADDALPDESPEPIENLPSAGTASESVAASHATEDEDDEEDDDDAMEGVGDKVETEDERIVEEGVSQDPADLSEFFSSSPMQEETSMDGAS
ncbi:bromodomain-containing protein 7-like isoform X3 [Littorina saxatilis]|uniref:bromodomain-containing protein 7-like isoform X3 n=1 Tax=Littorina saxatilis TaxID=31220 RepID=UPI0038B66C39